MGLREELQQAAQDYLQDQWDEFLLVRWRKYGYQHMNNSVRVFMGIHKLTSEQFNALQRIPVYDRHRNCSLSRYIAAYLPCLSTMLWDGNKTDEAMLAAMKGMRVLAVPVDKHKSSRERREISSSIKAARAENTVHFLVKDQRAMNSRSNWGVCKA